MAQQTTIKDYFPSSKLQGKGKKVTTKRPLESTTLKNKRRRVLTSSRDGKDSIPLCDIHTSLPSSLISPTTLSDKKPDPLEEATSAGVKYSNTKLNCFETSPSTVSPLRRGAECVRLALEKKILSPVSLGKDGQGREQVCETRRKLFSAEVTNNPVTTVKHSIDDFPAVKKFENKFDDDDYGISTRPVKQLITPLKKKTPDMTRSSKQVPKLKPFSSLQYDSPTKADKATPAYERYKSLAEPAAPPTDLPLPKHYGLLAEKFHCTDTIVNMFQRRGEICTFSKLKLAVQQMNGRFFAKSDIAKIKTVYPTVLLLAHQNHIPGAYGRDIFNSYQLTVECNTKELADDCGAPPVNKSTGITTHLASSVLLRRRQKFKRNLVAIVKQHHKEFLGKLSPPLSLTDDEIVRWHPAFILDNTPEVEEAPLPQPPSLQTCSTAKDVLEIIHSSVMPPHMQRALEDVAGASKSEDQQLPEPTNPAIDKALKGISQSLVDKIKMKESCNAKAAMTRTRVNEKKIAMLSVLPDMCRIIKNLFLADKKAAMPMETVTNKLMDSNGMSLDVVEAHLCFMEEVLPQWYKKVNVRKTCYVKIDRKMSIKNIIEQIEKYRDLL